MAKMKIEVLHHRLRVHGLPGRDRWIAHMPRWAPWAARMPAVANLRDRMPGAAWFGEHVLGIASRRSLPRWRRDAFTRGKPDSVRASEADVVLFVDTFNNYFEPENACAAHRVLRASGYRVHIARARG
jgi:Fe-S oxidoreductase